MDAAEYKAQKARLGAIRGDALDAILQTVIACDAQLASTIQNQLSCEPLETPTDHDDAPNSVWVRISLPDDLAEEVLDCLVDAEISALGPDYCTTAAASKAAEFVNIWQHWMEHHEA